MASVRFVRGRSYVSAFRINGLFSDSWTSLSPSQFFGDHDDGLCGQNFVGAGRLWATAVAGDFGWYLPMLAAVQNGGLGSAPDLSLPMMPHVVGKGGMQGVAAQGSLKGGNRALRAAG